MLSGKYLRRRGGSPADFLARLWARFGPPDPSDGGFRYQVRDRETGVEFTAYSGASGPAYRSHADDSRVAAALDAFERWIDQAAPADCRWLVNDGVVELGAEHGVPYERDRPPPDAELLGALAAAKTIDLAAAARETMFKALWKLRHERDRNPVAARRLRERIRRVAVALWERLFDIFEAQVTEAIVRGDREAVGRLFDDDWPQLVLGSDVQLPSSFEPRIRAMERIGAEAPRRIAINLPSSFAFHRSRGTSRRRR
jgi:hypothetical protein